MTVDIHKYQLASIQLSLKVKSHLNILYGQMIECLFQGTNSFFRYKYALNVFYQESNKPLVILRYLFIYYIIKIKNIILYKIYLKYNFSKKKIALNL